MGEATKVVQNLIDNAAEQGYALEELRVDEDMYDQLKLECFPADPSEVFGIPISGVPAHVLLEEERARRLH